MVTHLTDEDDTLTIHNEGFDPPGWVNICINDTCMDVHLSNLVPAISGFEKYYKDQLERDKM